MEGAGLVSGTGVGGEDKDLRIVRGGKGLTCWEFWALGRVYRTTTDTRQTDSAD